MHYLVSSAIVFVVRVDWVPQTRDLLKDLIPLMLDLQREDLFCRLIFPNSGCVKVGMNG